MGPMTRDDLLLVTAMLLILLLVVAIATGAPDTIMPMGMPTPVVWATPVT